MFDILVIGPITKDIIKIGDRPAKVMPGGTAYYTGLALKALEQDVGILSKADAHNREFLLQEFRNRDVPVTCLDSKDTTVFENNYIEDNLDARSQKILNVADPFDVADLVNVATKICHLGPVCQTDISVPFINELKQRSEVISLDIQGLLRQVSVDHNVFMQDLIDKRAFLKDIAILKANEEEARILSGKNSIENAAREISDMGPKEVIITKGGRGSLIYSYGSVCEIEAATPETIVDTTGCGDTYMAGYLTKRLHGSTVEEAGCFAAKIAGFKAKQYGAWIG